MSEGRTRRYSRVAIALHWLTAAAFAFQIGLGWQLDGPGGPQVFAAFQLHKALGIAILLLTLVRLGWRLVLPPPPLSGLAPIERALARGIHLLFYVLLIALPLSGWLIVSSSRVRIPTLLFGAVPWPHLPGLVQLAPGTKALVNQSAATAHSVMILLALAAILLHLLGALKYQLIEPGDSFGRMAPIAIGRGLGPFAIMLVAALIGLVGLGRFIVFAPIRRDSPPPAMPRSMSKLSPSSPSIALPIPPAAAAKPTSSTPVAAAQPAKWKVRSAESSIRFHSAWSQGPIEGSFGKWRAEIRFDPAALAASSAVVTIATGSVTAADDEQAGALPGDDWFAAAAFPTAQWTSTSFTADGGDGYAATGTLSLRGITRPLPIAFTLTIAGDVATMTGNATVDRTLFGVGQGAWAASGDVPAQVTVRIAIVADRIPSTPAKEKSR